MKLKYKTKTCFLKVNDVFDELREENKRLNEELMFANNCLKVLDEFKRLLFRICGKFETIIGSEDKQELNRLEEEFNSISKSSETKNQIKVEFNEKSTELSENLSENRDKNEINIRRSGRTDRKVYAIPVKRRLPKTESKPKRKPIVIPKPEEEPNSLLLLRRNNFDAKTQSYVCPNPFCDKSFDGRRKLYDHFRIIHCKKKTFFCSHENCKMSFRTGVALKSHSIKHSDYRPHCCPFEECDHRFKTKATLNTHINGFHSNIKPFKCEECGKTFKLSTVWKRHQLGHKSQLYFRCTFEDCQHLSNSAYDLEKHKKLVHNILRKLNECEWPGCGYQTHRPDSFKAHKRLHTGEKPYLCDWPDCGKTFRVRPHLKFHQLVHKNLKPVACVWPGCQYRCRTSANLYIHMKVHRK